MDILHLFAQSPLQPAYATPRARSPAPSAGRTGLRRLRGRPGRDRPRRAAASPSTTRARATRRWLQRLRAGRPAGDQRRVAGIHGRRRLSAAGVLARRRLGAGPGRGLGRAALLARARTAAGRHDPRTACGRSIRRRRSSTSASTRRRPTPPGPARACRPRRSGSTPSAARRRERSRAGERTRSGSGRPAPTRPIRGSPPAAGAVGEYNAKFMVGQMVLKGGACVTPAGHCAAELPQLLLSPPALDVLRRAAGARRYGGQRERQLSQPTWSPACPRRARPAGQVVLRRAGLGAVRSDLRDCRNTIRPGRRPRCCSGSPRSSRRGSRPARGWSNRQRRQPQDAAAARRGAADRRLHARRHQPLGARGGGRRRSRRDYPALAVDAAAWETSRRPAVDLGRGRRRHGDLLPRLDHRQLRPGRGGLPADGAEAGCWARGARSSSASIWSRTRPRWWRPTTTPRA